MEKPFKYIVLFGGENNNEKCKQTDNIETAKKWELLYNGTIYEDTRYQAKKRLYWYLWRKQNYLESI